MNEPNVSDSSSGAVGPSRVPTPVKRRRLRRLFWALGLLCLAFWLLWLWPFWGVPFNHTRHGRPPLTPAWALECWLWEDDRNTASAVRELLDGYKRHDLPVRTVLIDSPWSTHYNDFQVDEARYPEPARFFQELQTNGYRVVLWMTCLVNSRDKDTALKQDASFYESARDRGFLAGGGHQVSWWKGRGGFIDYTNPQALEWWHGMQRQVLDWGVDGWKLDGADTLFSGPGFIPFQSVHSGWLTTRGYMDLYNREEYRHGLSRNPEFIVLTRGVDDRYFPLSHPEGFAPIDAAPVAWVGDRTHQWSSKRGGGGQDQDAMKDSDSWLDRGFEGALRDILASSKLGYPVVGDDVAGYHGREPIPANLYIRWSQFAAFTGLFLNGGHGERRTWLRSSVELEQFRRFAWLHTELVPYLYTLVMRCHEGGPSLIRPAPGPYHYHLGDDLFVAPIYRDTNSAAHQVELPAGRWRNLLEDEEVISGPTQFERRFDLSQYPVYVREGAILPMNVSRAYTGFGDGDSAGRRTWVIYPGQERSTGLFHATEGGKPTRATVERLPDKVLKVAFDGPTQAHVLRVKWASTPKTVVLDGDRLVPGVDWRFDTNHHWLWVRPKSAVGHVYEIRGE